MWSAVGRKVSQGRIMRLWYTIVYALTKNNIANIYHFLIKISSNKKTEYVRALTFPLPNKQIGYKREWYRQYDKIAFEGYRFQVEKSYLEWLKSEFGDYMSLPPVGKRKTHPVSKIKLPERKNV